MASLTLSCRAADTNLGGVSRNSISYAERAASTLAETTMHHRLGTSLVSGSDVEITTPGVHPSSEVESRGSFRA
jgi:hypothetical protein